MISAVCRPTLTAAYSEYEVSLYSWMCSGLKQLIFVKKIKNGTVLSKLYSKVTIQYEFIPIYVLKFKNHEKFGVPTNRF